MVGSQKILTVSYGTFSCTLEGFDDSFETMKAIAEYFRDLAADDRYFGAEPPQPDAEMLARIAEREVARRVEARMETSGIVLRVGQAMDSGNAAPQAAPVVERAVTPAMPPVAQGQAEDVVAPVVAAPQAESVAAKLERIRAVVGKGAAAAAVAPLVEDAAEEAESEPVRSGALAALVAEANRGAEPVVTEAVADVMADVAADEAVEDELVDSVMAAMAEEAAPVIAVAEEAVVVVEAAEEAAIAEPEVVAFADQAFVAVEAAEEAVIAEPEMAADEVVQAEEYGDVAPELADLPVGEVAAPQPIRARVIRMRKADFERAIAAGAIVAEESVDETPVAEIGADLAADLAEAAERAEDDFVDLSDLSELSDEDELADLARLDAGMAPLSADDEADLLAELAAVEMDAADDVAAAADVEDDLGAELAAIEAAHEEEDPMAEVLRAMQAEPMGMDDLIAEADAAELDAEAEVAEVAEAEPEAVIAADDAFDDLLADEPEPEVAQEPARARFVAPEADEAALSRLLSETDAQMSGPDAARRREAIAQLRAAVAATEAARALGEPAAAAEPAESEDDFREDLRQAVRPRRPVAGQGDLRSERPKAAPLKLVASQRIDLPETVPSAAPVQPVAGQPIRPRRVTVEQIAAREEETVGTFDRETSAVVASSDSFADFAERMGAVSLADKLEAAAAYAAFVEGSGDFSRPQILRRVNQISPDASKEDGLRLFGTLLREGRIKRSERMGRFEVAEDTRFNPDRRAV
jgi:hypothetical protein